MPPPTPYLAMRASNPDLVRAYEAFSASCAAAGPLDAKTIALVKLAISLGAGLQGASHSHARKALDAGWTTAELLHAATISAPTVGFPTMMRNRSWITDVISPNQDTPG